MFENMFINKEEKLQQQAEERAIQTQKEDTATQIASQEDAYISQQGQNSDLIRWQQELNEDLEVLKQHLRGKTWSHYEQKWKQNKAPLLTEEGIYMVELAIEPLISKNLINSNLDEKRILYLLKDTSNTIVANLADNYDTYVIDASPSNLSHITRLIKNVYIPTPFRALNGWTKKQDTTATRRVETFNDKGERDAQKKKFGVF